MSELTKDPNNARRHTDRNKALIRQSLEELGAFRSIAVDGDDVIRAGNGVFEQAQELGLKVRIVEAAPDELIAVKRPDLTGDKAARAALYDNQTAELSEWDAEVLGILADSSPQTILGIIDGADILAMIEDAEKSKAAEAGLDQDASSDKAQSMNVRIRPVISIPDTLELERAIFGTGIADRGRALIEICRYYNAHAKNSDN